MALTDRKYVQDLLSSHGFTFSKAMGQNFLINPSVCPRMAENCIDDENFGIIEIGPGIGVLTQELCKRAKKVVCIELDKRLLPILDETLKEFDNVEIINDDVLNVDLASLIKEKFTGLKVSVCANLPYYITTPIIMKLLEEELPIESITVMVQKEAGVRLCASPGTRDCGAVSAAVFCYSEPMRLFNVSSGSFMPAPNVDSCVIKLIVRKTPLVDIKNREKFFKIVRGAFSQRRKTLINSLSSSINATKEDISKALTFSNIKLTARAEELTLDDFNKLNDYLDF